jgi:hypothetical protein
MLDGTGIRGLASADAVVVAVTSSSGAATCHKSAEVSVESRADVSNETNQQSGEQTIYVK